MITMSGNYHDHNTYTYMWHVAMHKHKKKQNHYNQVVIFGCLIAMTFCKHTKFDQPTSCTFGAEEMAQLIYKE